MPGLPRCPRRVSTSSSVSRSRTGAIGSGSEALRDRVRPYILRRTKDAVAPELPAKTQLVRSVDLSGPQRELLREHPGLGARRCPQAHQAARARRLDDRDPRRACFKLRQVCCDPRLVSCDAAAPEVHRQREARYPARADHRLARDRGAGSSCSRSSRGCSVWSPRGCSRAASATSR